ncbi:MAG: YkvA family protein, partial [bacterium]|nr:YkvA family protein [bacterium]
MNDLQKARDALLFIPRLVALTGRLADDPEVPGREKAILVAGLAYVISPVDVIPDIIPVLGQIDDLYLLALILLRFMNRVSEAKLRQHWKGPEDIVSVLRRATDVAVRVLPPRLRGLVERRVEAVESKEGSR